MTKDYSTILSSALDKHEERAAAIKAEEDRRNADFAARRENATSVLNHKVRPLVQAAAAQFSQKGIPIVVKDNWSSGPGTPSVYTLSVQAEGPPRRNSIGGTATPRSHAAFFQHDGKVLKAGLARTEHDTYLRDPKICPPDEIESRTESILSDLLETYFKSVEAALRA